jgi:hypothetical protein
MNEYVTIKEIAQAKGLKSTRSIRMEINKPESKYISREVKVNGGIAACKLNRDFIGIEIEKEYFDAANKRFQDYKCKIKEYAMNSF